MGSQPAVDVVDGPRLEARDAVPTLGIRAVVPFRSMLANRDLLLDELIRWLTEHHVAVTGSFFLRLHVTDMAGLMDIEVGVMAESAEAADVDARVRAGVIPAGTYAVLTYRATSMAANRLLLQWAAERGYELDSRDSPTGDVFASRCEIYVTDPRHERRKKAWVVQLAILTALGPV